MNSLRPRIPATAIGGPMTSAQTGTLPRPPAGRAEGEAGQPRAVARHRVRPPAQAILMPAMKPVRICSFRLRFARGGVLQERVIGLRIAGVAKPRPFVELAKTSGVGDDRAGADPLPSASTGKIPSPSPWMTRAGNCRRSSTTGLPGTPFTWRLNVMKMSSAPIPQASQRPRRRAGRRPDAGDCCRRAAGFGLSASCRSRR